MAILKADWETERMVQPSGKGAGVTGSTGAMTESVDGAWGGAVAEPAQLTIARATTNTPQIFAIGLITCSVSHDSSPM